MKNSINLNFQWNLYVIDVKLNSGLAPTEVKIENSDFDIFVKSIKEKTHKINSKLCPTKF